MMVMERLRRGLLGFSWVGYVNWLTVATRRFCSAIEQRFVRKPVFRELKAASAFDQAYGVSTAGYRPWRQLRTGSWSDPYVSAYEPSAPSVVRAVMAQLKDPEAFTFVDLGCGMGRALIIASEFSFKGIVGVEKVQSLYSTACQNATIIKANYPDRRDIQVVLGEASSTPLPSGDLVLYLFHPFLKPVMKELIGMIVAALKAEERRLMVVYLNPVLGAMLDRCPALVPDDEESFIIPPDDERQTRFVVRIWRNRSS